MPGAGAVHHIKPGLPALGAACPLPPAADMPPFWLWAAMCHKATYAVQQVLVAFRLAIAAARQAHCKHRTFAHLGRHDHIAAHHACELAGDGESEPGAAEALRGRLIGLGNSSNSFCCANREASKGI